MTDTLLPMDDDEIETTITVTLAAYSKEFPQLRGKDVRPDLRDDARRNFARTLVEHLKRSGVRFARQEGSQAFSTSYPFRAPGIK